MAIASLPSVILDCADPGELARFYGALLDWSVHVRDDGSWGEVRTDDNCICFQRVDGYQPPDWPGQQRPQQLHLDFMVGDLDAAEVAAVELGAIKHEVQPGTSFRVFLDPAGHPFCLCVD